MRVYELWITALRSNLYLQTRIEYAGLRESDGLTAVGVLCVLAVNAGVLSTFPTGITMPLEVQRWAGLRVPYRAPFPLDDDGRTFAQFADDLEKHASELFEG